MSLLITGGLGFLGQQIARHMLRVGSVWSSKFEQAVPLQQLTLFDATFRQSMEALTSDERLRVKTGDLTEEGIPEELIDSDDVAVVHLASMVSGDTEAEPERGWATNVEGQRRLLAALQVWNRPPQTAPDRHRQ